MKKMIVTTTLAVCLMTSSAFAATPELINEPVLINETVTINLPATVGEVSEVMDAYQYRGVITDYRTEENGDVILTLQQPDGRDYGHGTLNVIVTEDTRSSVGEVQVGDFLEVYYGAADTNIMPATTNAIAIKKLMPAEAVNYNGFVSDVQFDDETKTSGRILMKGNTNDDYVYFHFNAGTAFYLDVEDLKIGDELNIYHTGIFAMSMPPQGQALEVKPYYEAEEGNIIELDQNTTEAAATVGDRIVITLPMDGEHNWMYEVSNEGALAFVDMKDITDENGDAFRQYTFKVNRKGEHYLFYNQTDAQWALTPGPTFQILAIDAATEDGAYETYEGIYEGIEIGAVKMTADGRTFYFFNENAEAMAKGIEVGATIRVQAEPGYNGYNLISVEAIQ